MDAKMLAIVGALMLAATGAYMAFHPQTVDEMSTAFENFKAKHGKTYASEAEEAYRFAVYVENIKMINEHNAKGTETYTMAENHMADLHHEEFKAIYLGYAPKTQVNDVEELAFEDNEVVGDVNWVTAGKVQHVKDQGQCGSCWAFSTVASSESLKAINGGSIGDFSEQQLVDCSGSYGNNGCNGGLMDYGFEYFHDHGICTESSYTYTAKDGSCKASSCTKDSFTIGGYKDVTHGIFQSKTKALQEACDKQPISIAVDAQNWSFYSGGVFNNCGTSLDHGVLLAGYSADHWLVKNSWGASWGESGYIRLASGNTCGLANQPSYPTA